LKCRIVFPESGDERVLAAASQIERSGMGTAILVTDNSRLAGNSSSSGLRSVHAQDESALEFAHRMVARGEADACVAGAVYTTADVLRSARKNVGPAPGVHIPASARYMVVGSGAELDEVLTFTDCAGVPSPAAVARADSW